MSPSGAGADPFPGLFAALETRHLANLEFAEVRRALQALSAHYVEGRAAGGPARALESVGKRAAFALFYGPLHFLITRAIVARLAAVDPPPNRILDLGCGTGMAGAAWAASCARRPELTGVERNPWAAEEARWTWRTLGLGGRVTTGDLMRSRFPGAGSAVLLAWTVNELDGGTRSTLLGEILTAGRKGCRVLVIEPISRSLTPWWDVWAGKFAAAGGRSDDWRFPAELPGRLGLLDRAAGLDHRELTARSLWLSPA